MKQINIKSKKLWIIAVVVVVVVLAALWYWRHQDIYPSTDDAYVQANVVHVAAQVSGKVKAIEVRNHQMVKKGQLLFEIDPTSFENALVKAQAQYQLQQSQLVADQTQVKSAEAKLAQAQAKLNVEQIKAQRILTLAKRGDVSKEEGDEARGSWQEASAGVSAAQAAVANAKQDLTVQKNQVNAAKAAEQEAHLNLTYAKVYASTTGQVDNFKLRVGSYIQAGVSQFDLVDTQHWWVNANFKETQLARIRVGQPAEISVDMYSNHTYKGTVQSISAGSGESFSLLPPENASGNWVKVTQRFPVKVVIPVSQLNAKYPLRVGSSASVTVNTHGQKS